MGDYFNENLVIEDYPLMVLPKLALAIGLEEAIVFQQVFWLLKNPRNGKMIGESRWIFNTYEQWQKTYFPFWSHATVQRIFNRIESMGLFLSCQPEGGISRRKYYRINEGILVRLKEGRVSVPKLKGSWRKSTSHQIDAMDTSNCYVPITETTAQKTKESKETAEVSAACIPSTWKPNPQSKQEQLEQRQNPKQFPSQEEFDSFLQARSCTQIDELRSDLYYELCVNKWSQWDEKNNRWKPIRDWRAYVLALEEKMQQVF